MRRFRAWFTDFKHPGANIPAIYVNCRIGRMPRMSNIKIAGRIAITTILPLLAFTVFAAKGLLEKWSTYQSAGRVTAVIETVPSISNLVHHLQRERGASATF